MPFDFKFPDVGEGIHEGEIKEILIKVGDIVKEHDIVARVETDKAIVDIPISKGGTVLALPHKVGDTIKVGEVLVVVGDKNEKASSKPAEKASIVKEDKSTSVVGFLPEAPEEEEEKKPPIKDASPIDHKIQKTLATPAVRRLARDLHVDLSTIHGSGNAGRITEDDVRKAASSESKSSAPAVRVQSKFDFFGGIEHIPLKGVRRTIAQRMVESYTKIPHVTHFDEADVTDLWKIREKEKTKAEKKGIKLTFLPFIVKACIEGLKEFPYLNAALDEEHEEIVLKKYYNIGIAVDTEDGLMVPVIKEADQKGISQIAKEIAAMAQKSKDRTLDLADLQGGTFTITNVGSAGGLFATPIINYPQSAIIATGKIYDKVVAVDGKPEIRKILPLSVTFDHRVLDGAQAARFTNRIKQVLEDPDELLID